MMAITQEFKNKVREALMTLRPNFDGADHAFAIKNGLNYSYYSQIKNGKIDIGMSDGKWIALARKLGVGDHNRKWNTVRTIVFNQIEEEVKFCQDASKAMIFVDECGIGKSYTAKYLSRTLNNCFYIDGSQSRSKGQFIRSIAKELGLDYADRTSDIKENIKYVLKVLAKPIIIIDEAGDLEYSTLLEIKELWNATEGSCGWYMMGADGLKAKIEKGIKNKVVGFRELFSRFSSTYSYCVPTGRQEKIAFYQNITRVVIEANIADKSNLDEMVRQCITKDADGNISGLRRAESLLIMNQQAH
ncbi:MAG TPA: ATP-binding protein [Mucilaginibacter sp.]|jgi:DNA transposition AAA+ family ATPase|nr:ATP-binding protein [Mucilaginibacter sp.]